MCPAHLFCSKYFTCNRLASVHWALLSVIAATICFNVIDLLVLVDDMPAVTLAQISYAAQEDDAKKNLSQIAKILQNTNRKTFCL